MLRFSLFPLVLLLIFLLFPAYFCSIFIVSQSTIHWAPLINDKTRIFNFNNTFSCYNPKFNAFINYVGSYYCQESANGYFTYSIKTNDTDYNLYSCNLTNSTLIGCSGTCTRRADEDQVPSCFVNEMCINGTNIHLNPIVDNLIVSIHSLDLYNVTFSVRWDIICETAPTNSPTLYPSVIPSNDPSNNPTHYPSDVPTLFPSLNPSKNPSKYPTREPIIGTREPSNVPSNYPSIIPTNLPSIIPTYVPSNIPSNNPSNTPTNIPSNEPSLLPTINPTIPDNLSKNSDDSSNNFIFSVYGIIILCVSCLLIGICMALIAFRRLNKNKSLQEIQLEVTKRLPPPQVKNSPVMVPQDSFVPGKPNIIPGEKEFVIDENIAGPMVRKRINTQQTVIPGTEGLNIINVDSEELFTVQGNNNQDTPVGNDTPVGDDESVKITNIMPDSGSSQSSDNDIVDTEEMVTIGEFQE